MNEPGPAREYHRLTEHQPGFAPKHDDRLVVDFEPMRPGRKPPQFKRYEGVDVVPLPPDPAESGEDAVSVLSGETEPLETGLDLDRLSNLLFHSAGVVRVAEVPGTGRMFFRAAGSAGNLSPLEAYVLARGVQGLDDGLYHYDPLKHTLDRLGGTRGSEGPTTVVITGVPWRTGWKYAERGFRHLYWDAGTMLANLLAVAEAGGHGARLQLGFVDAEINRLLGVDGVHEFTLALVTFAEVAGTPGPGPSGLLAEAATPPPQGFLARDPMEFPLITATQRAGDLQSHDDVAGWRARASGGATSTAAGQTAPGTQRVPRRPPPAGEGIEAVIRRRGSTREFDSSVIATNDVFWWVMAAATRSLPADFVARGATLLEHHLGVHSVEGVEPGVYRWTGEGAEQRGTGEVRTACAQLCLGQLLGGSGSYTVFHAAALDPLVEVLGSRGYRAAQLEAGVVEGRLHLAAFALGFGATGLTFFDDEVRRFLRISASTMLVTAVGRPAYRSRRGGRPLRPVRIGR